MTHQGSSATEAVTTRISRVFMRDFCLYSLSIKGEPNEDAVLCTADKTYTVRSVVLSNSMLVIVPPKDTELDGGRSDDLVIRDQLHEILELVPSLPKMQKLGGLLRGREYDEGREEEDEMDVDPDGGRWVCACIASSRVGR